VLSSSETRLDAEGFSLRLDGRTVAYIANHNYYARFCTNCQCDLSKAYLRDGAWVCMHAIDNPFRESYNMSMVMTRVIYSWEGLNGEHDFQEQA
jgi:hypothetical protein